MATDSDASEVTTLAPDDPFAVLGNETRIDILQTRSTAGELLTFSDLRGNVGMRDPGQFNYHLDKLIGHLVRQTDSGYERRQAGRRIIEAVLSGAVAAVPNLEPAQVDRPCPYCEAPIMVSCDAMSPRPVKVSCTECAGAAGWIVPFEHGQFGALRFSPVGFHGRTPHELLQATTAWEHLEILAALSDVCPRCAENQNGKTLCDRGSCDVIP